VYGTSLVGG